MQRIGKIHSSFAPLQRLSNDQRLFKFDIGQPAQLTKGMHHHPVLKAIQAAQHPFGSKQHSLGDKDRFFFEQRGGSFGLPGIIASQQAHQDVGINRDHDAILFLP